MTCAQERNSLETHMYGGIANYQVQGATKARNGRLSAAATRRFHRLLRRSLAMTGRARQVADRFS